MRRTLRKKSLGQHAGFLFILCKYLLTHTLFIILQTKLAPAPVVRCMSCYFGDFIIEYFTY